ncbi:MAG: hypothetical protein P8Y91_00595 [Desulfuromonadales bacterium]|jgi:uncharacterized membrane protein/rubredoxin
MTKRWQCSVCGYIHTGEEPPETCPVCGADRSQFVLIEEKSSRLLPSMRDHFRLHPIVAHFPNGLIPTALFFVVLALAAQSSRLEETAFWLLMVAGAVIPVSLISGLYEWRKEFAGRRAAIFTKKIVLASLLLVLALLALILRGGQAGLLLRNDLQSWLYGGVLLGMLLCVILLGHYGSILVASLYSTSSQESVD